MSQSVGKLLVIGEQEEGSLMTSSCSTMNPLTMEFHENELQRMTTEQLANYYHLYNASNARKTMRLIKRAFDELVSIDFML